MSSVQNTEEVKLIIELKLLSAGSYIRVIDG